MRKAFFLTRISLSSLSLGFSCEGKRILHVENEKPDLDFKIINEEKGFLIKDKGILMKKNKILIWKDSFFIKKQFFLARKMDS